MAKGYPDYFGQGIFEKRGPLTGWTAGALNVAAFSWGYYTQSGYKGLIESGRLHITLITNFAAVYVEARIDGAPVNGNDLATMLQAKGNANRSHTFSINKYDVSTGIADLCPSYQISFENEFIVAILNNQATLITCDLQFQYDNVVTV
jgi:hypothetical protein